MKEYLPLFFCRICLRQKGEMVLLFAVLMMGLNRPAKEALPIAWGLAGIIGILAWKMDIRTVAATTLYGFLSSIEVLLVIFGAILIMNTLKHSGGMASINRGFMHLSRDILYFSKQIYILFILFYSKNFLLHYPAVLIKVYSTLSYRRGPSAHICRKAQHLQRELPCPCPESFQAQGNTFRLIQTQ